MDIMKLIDWIKSIVKSK